MCLLLKNLYCVFQRPERVAKKRSFGYYEDADVEETAPTTPSSSPSVPLPGDRKRSLEIDTHVFYKKTAKMAARKDGGQMVSKAKAAMVAQQVRAELKIVAFCRLI